VGGGWVGRGSNQVAQYLRLFITTPVGGVLSSAPQSWPQHPSAAAAGRKRKITVAIIYHKKE